MRDWNVFLRVVGTLLVGLLLVTRWPILYATMSLIFAVYGCYVIRLGLKGVAKGAQSDPELQTQYRDWGKKTIVLGCFYLVFALMFFGNYLSPPGNGR